MTGPDRSDAEIQPFRIEIPQPDVDDLKDRLARTRWPDDFPDAGWSTGVPLGYLKELARYWRDRLRLASARGRRSTGSPSSPPMIDGQTIHFLHVRSPEPSALPLVVSHGYPGSIVGIHRGHRTTHRSAAVRLVGLGRRLRRRGAVAARVRVLRPGSLSPAGRVGPNGRQPSRNS